MAEYLCLRKCQFLGRIYEANEKYELNPKDKPPHHFQPLEADAKGEKKAASKAAKAKDQADPVPADQRAALLVKAKSLEVQVDDAWTLEQLAHAVAQAEANPPKLPGV